MELQSTAVLWWTLLSSYSKRDCRSTWWICQKLKERSNTKWMPPQVLIASCCFFGLLVDSIASRKDWVSVRWSNAFVLLGVLERKRNNPVFLKVLSICLQLTTSFKVIKPNHGRIKPLFRNLQADLSCQGEAQPSKRKRNPPRAIYQCVLFLWHAQHNPHNIPTSQRGEVLLLG